MHELNHMLEMEMHAPPVDNAYLLVLIKELDTLHAVVMHELNHMLEMEMHAPPNQYYDSSSASIF
jgi:hypothetical protein